MRPIKHAAETIEARVCATLDKVDALIDEAGNGVYVEIDFKGVKVPLRLKVIANDKAAELEATGQVRTLGELIAEFKALAGMAG